MSRSSSATESMALVAAILISVACWTGLRADEGDRKKEPDRDCVNSLRQLWGGVHEYMGSKSNRGHIYPGPGQKLFSDLFDLPSKKGAILGDNFALLVCKRAGDDKALDRLKKGDWDAMSYECWEGQVSKDGTVPEAPVAWDKNAVHDNKRNVLLFSGDVAEMTDKELEEAKRKHKEKPKK